MIERLIFGCGHLIAGAAQARANTLVSQCLDAGLRRFDTAPVYGLGTSELALGMALRRDGRAALINTKVGLPRPRYGVLKSYVRAAKRIVAHPNKPLGAPPLRADDARLPRGCFDLGVMAPSLAGSLHCLGVPSVDTLFLHEAYTDNLSPHAVAFLRDAQTRGLARTLGVANGAEFDPSLAALVPRGFLLQSAAPGNFFDGEERAPHEALIFHTVINSFFRRRAVDSRLNGAVEASCRRFKIILGDDPGGAIVLGYLLLGAAAPKAKLIYTTEAPTRLNAFLKAMCAVEREKAAADIVAFVSVQLRNLGTGSARGVAPETGKTG